MTIKHIPVAQSASVGLPSNSPVTATPGTGLSTAEIRQIVLEVIG